MHSAVDFHPELLLCDIDMPDRDGVDLISAIDRTDPTCRILVLTGAYSSISRVREHAASLRRNCPILSKPCAPAEVLREANTLLLSA